MCSHVLETEIWRYLSCFENWTENAAVPACPCEGVGSLTVPGACLLHWTFCDPQPQGLAGSAAMFAFPPLPVLSTDGNLNVVCRASQLMGWEHFRASTPPNECRQEGSFLGKQGHFLSQPCLLWRGLLGQEWGVISSGRVMGSSMMPATSQGWTL